MFVKIDFNATRLLISLNIIVFLLGFLVHSESVSLLGGSQYLMTHFGVYKNVVTSNILWANFVHNGLIHLGMNMLALHNIGTIVESRIGKWYFLNFYIITGIISMLISGLYYDSYVLGASGCICGVFGILSVMIVHNYLTNNNSNQASYLMKTMTKNIIILTVLSLLPFVAGLTHLIGFIVGILAGIALIIKYPHYRFF